MYTHVDIARVYTCHTIFTQRSIKHSRKLSPGHQNVMGGPCHTRTGEVCALPGGPNGEDQISNIRCPVGNDRENSERTLDAFVTC